MALTPKERADFDEIVLRLRMEDADIGVVQPKRPTFALMLSMIVATLVFGLGVVLVGHGVWGPILITLVLVAALSYLGRSWWRSHSARRRTR
jgi:hypothetical protein